MNRSAPFWDFVASLEQEGMNHPFFSQWAPNQNAHEGAAEGQENQSENRDDHPPPPPPFGPWGWAFPGFGGGRGFPYRGPPPPPHPPAYEGHENEKENGNQNEKDNDNGEGPSGSGSDNEGCRRGGSRGRCGNRRGRPGCGPHGRGFGPGPHGHGPPHHGHFGRRGGWGRCGRGGPFGFGGGPFNPLQFAAGLFDPSTPDQANKDNEDFTPEADIFVTPSAYVIHISLPGAKNEDVGVHYNPEKSELCIAGVIYRPGDEEFLKTLDMGERKVGPFERKIRLGTRANPAVVDVEGITAKLEDGLLRVEVPKMEEGFVEVKKVDVE